jgi:argininosuccinate lyase
MTNPEGGSGGSSKLWGGRFSGEMSEIVERFNASIDIDRRLYREDIAGSIAHAHMLAAQGIIPAADAKAIERGLTEIRAEIDAGTFEFRLDREDIHLNIEAADRARR